MNGSTFMKEIEEALASELGEFKDETLKLSKEQVYENAYRIMAMQYIYDQLVEYMYHLSDMEICSLIGQKDILERIYCEWMKEPMVEEEDLNECIKQFVEKIVKEESYGEAGKYKKSIA